MFADREHSTIFCKEHPGLPITHLCCLEDCLAPLCAKCIKIHTNFHKQENVFAEIETLEDIKQFCTSKVRSSVITYTAELDGLERSLHNNNTQFKQSPVKNFNNSKKSNSALELIRQVKQSILEMVYIYFDKLEKDYEAALFQTNTYLDAQTINFKQIEQFLRKQIAKLDNYYQELDGSNCIYTIKYILTKDFEQELKEIKKDISGLKLQETNQNEPKLIVDEQAMHNLKSTFEKICYFENQYLFQPIQNKIQSLNNNFSFVPIASNANTIDKNNFINNYQPPLSFANDNNQQTSSFSQSNNLTSDSTKILLQPLPASYQFEQQRTLDQKINPNKNKIFDNSAQNSEPTFLNNDLLSRETNITNNNNIKNPVQKVISYTQNSKLLFSPKTEDIDKSVNQKEIIPYNILNDNQGDINNNNFDIQDNPNFKNEDQKENTLNTIQQIYNPYQQNEDQIFYINKTDQSRNSQQKLSTLSTNQQLNDEQFQSTNNENNNYRIADQLQPDKQQQIIVHNFEIKTNDYFDQNSNKKYLHFFQHKSKIVHFVNLEDLHNNIQPQFYQLELEINFKIPRWHRSITLPNGQIYMTGGVSTEMKDVKLKNCYILSFEQCTLKPISNMQVGRSGHALVYLDQCIYAIGGFTENQEFTNSCEKFNIQQNKWVEIAPMNYRANNPCATSYNEHCIFKFGGKIDDYMLNKYVEKYIVDMDIWQVIEFSINQSFAKQFALLSSAGCVQINDKQIFVFGGTYEDYSNKSCQSFLFHVEEQTFLDSSLSKSEVPPMYTIKGYNDKPLSYAEGLWNNQAIIFKGNLYCLQNVSQENEKTVVYLDRRRILRFNSILWEVLNDQQIKDQE